MTPAFRAPSFIEGDETAKSDDGVPAPLRTGAISHAYATFPKKTGVFAMFTSQIGLNRAAGRSLSGALLWNLAGVTWLR